MDLVHVVSQTAFVETPEPKTGVGVENIDDLSLEELVDQRYFTHAASRARLKITQSRDPYKWSEIFEWWYLRLCCLRKAGLESVAVEEARGLGESGARRYRDENGECQVPWKLRLLLVALQSERAGSVALSKYYVLAREARTEAARGAERGGHEAACVWRSRLRQLGLWVAVCLVDMKESTTAIEHLESLRTTAIASGEDESVKFVAQIELVLAAAHVRIGRTEAAQEIVQRLDDRALLALCLLIQGDSTGAEAVCKESGSQNNLAITYLQTGRVAEATRVLRELALEPAASTSTAVSNLLVLSELTNTRESLLEALCQAGVYREER